MSRNPSLKAISFNNLADKYGAFGFQDALADFIAQTNHPEASAMALRALAEDTLLPFQSVPVFHKIKFVSTRDSDIIDTVHVRLDQRDARGRLIPACFDTVIVSGGVLRLDFTHTQIHWTASLLFSLPHTEAHVRYDLEFGLRTIRSPSSFLYDMIPWFFPVRYQSRSHRYYDT